MKKNNFFYEYDFYCLTKTFRIMRISILFLLVSVMQTLAIDAYSQKMILSLDLSNKKLVDVMDEIEDQSEFYFLYNEKLIDLDKVVSISVDDQKIDEILDQLFSESDVDYTITDRKIILAPSHLSGTQAQQSVVSGRVIDEDGEPLPGVTVMVKGTTNGTITDFDGNYTLSVSVSTPILVFSFVGMKTQEINLDGRTTLKVTLEEEAIGLDEVVAIGYGTQKKETVTGAISTVQSETITSSPVTKVTDGLAGKLAGVIINQRGGEPGETTTELFIRGVSTTGNNAPLYVIDGIVRDYNGLDRLDPNEIESINILKDASAAIYGAQAANGVVLVTTKRGGVGKPTLEFSHNTGFNQATRLPRTASSGQYAEAANLANYLKGLPERWTDEEVQKFYDGSEPYKYPNTNWYGLMYADWQMQSKTNLSVTGGSENVKYFVSGGYMNQDSPYEQGFTHNKQYNFRSNIDAKINDNLNVSFNVSGRLDDIMTTQVDYWHIVLGYPYQLPINPNGSFGEGRTGENAVAMVRDKDYGYDAIDRGVLTADLTAKWNVPFISGLSVEGTFAYDYNKSYSKSGQDVWYYSQYDPDSDTYTKKKGTRTAQPSLDVSFNQGTYITSKFVANYVKSFGQHNFDAILGYEQSETHTNYLAAGRQDFLSFEIEELFAGTADKNFQTSDGSSNNTARQNYFGRVNYDYAKKYLLSFTLRRDGSQNFSEDNRWGWFPSVSAGWLVSEESFMESVNWLDFLKVRGSWGQMGNDRVNAYQYLASYEYGSNATFGGTTAQGLVSSNVPNPNITWEIATSTNIALESMLFNQNLGVNVDIFKTRRENILATRNASVPQYTGLELPDENFGIVDNKGIELTLTHRGKIGEVGYAFDGNFTYVKNEVIDIDEAPYAEDYMYLTGHPIGAPLIYEIDDFSGGIFNSADEVAEYGAVLPGTKQGDLVRKDVNGDGYLNTNDQVRQDWTSTPQIIFGLNMNFDYKGFDLSLNWQGQAKAKISPMAFWPFDPLAWGNFNPWLLEDGWTLDNTDGSKPAPGQSFTTNYAGTAFTYVSSAFFRLKNAQIGYTLPKELVSKAGISNARVYMSGYNLFSFDKLKDFGVDPEQTSQATTPPQRVINLGVSLTF